jgi:2-oxoglutarate ferredoxin oxidoreductase subunit alpha
MLTGNDALAQAAIAAGMRFYAGYPITPSSEVAEHLSRLLPLHGGVFIAMEDEIASIGAIIGASLAGTKSMTATSGPGFSLMQENIGYACMTEVPIVVVNVMRGGPSTGLPTLPAQSDVMQARWGTHGDHPIIALTPYSVLETYELTVRGFNLAERYRVPVIMLLDETVAHVSEKVTLPDPSTLEIIDRVRPTCPPEEYLAYGDTESGVPPMADIGEGYRHHVTGLFHDQTGFPTNDASEIDRQMRRLCRKIDQARDDIVEVDPYLMDDAEIGVVAFGSAARASRHAVLMARENGVKVGLLRPRTLWPFMDKEIRAYAPRVKAWVVPEMNLGQIAHEVEWAVRGQGEVHRVNRVDGNLIEPRQVLDKIHEVCR